MKGNVNDANTHEFRLIFFRQNTRLTYQSNTWNVLLFKEAYHIKEKYPILDNGVIASREMQIFLMSFNYNLYRNHILTVSFYSNTLLDDILLVIKLV